MRLYFAVKCSRIARSIRWGGGDQWSPGKQGPSELCTMLPFFGLNNIFLIFAVSRNGQSKKLELHSITLTTEVTRRMIAQQYQLCHQSQSRYWWLLSLLWPVQLDVGWRHYTAIQWPFPCASWFNRLRGTVPMRRTTRCFPRPRLHWINFLSFFESDLCSLLRSLPRCPIPIFRNVPV